MTDQAEALARRIREKLGPFNDPELPVTECVANLVSQQSAPVVKLPSQDDLAAFIRRVDGSHRLGAAELSEKIIDYIAAGVKYED